MNAVTSARSFFRAGAESGAPLTSALTVAPTGCDTASAGPGPSRFRLLPPRSWIALTLVLSLAGCEGGTGPDGGDPPDDRIGPEGGTLVVDAVRLDIPPGALDEAVEITVTPLSDAASAAPDDFLVVPGTGFALGPAGLTFDEPATLTISFAGAPLPAGISVAELRLVRLDGEGAVMPGSVEVDQQVVRGTIEGFSSFGAGLETSFARESCPDLSLETANGMPLDRVSLGRVPETFEPPLLVVATAMDGETRSHGVVEADEEGDARMVVPIHPSGDPAGGDVRINVSDGTRACGALAFAVEPLPPSDGELAAVVDLLQEIVRAQAAELDATPEELIEIPVEELPHVLIPLAMAQSAIDHPENDHSLRAIVDGTSTEAAEARLDLIDPLLARTDLRAELTRILTAAQMSAVRSRSPWPLVGANRTVPRQVAIALCTPEYVENAARLDSCMTRAASRPFGGLDIESLDELSEAMMYLGLVPGLGTATAIGGAVIWVVQTQHKRNASLLPSLFTRMDLEAEPTVFLEDEGGTGRWSADVYATSKGYDLGKEFISAAFQGAGLASLADAVDIAGPAVDELTGWVVTGPVADKLLEGATLEEFVIAASDYGPVSVTSGEWTYTTFYGEAVDSIEHRTYEPVQPGPAVLEVRTRPDKFGGQQIGAERELRVEELWLTITPDERVVGPDESRTFTVEVHNSKHPDSVAVDTIGEPLQGTVESITDIGGAKHRVVYTAPSDPDPDRPDLLVVEHTANTGAREDSPERRVASATIRFSELITISPRSACLEPGGVQTFTAEVTGPNLPEIRWEIESGGGSLSSTVGYSVDYTAPDGRGTATLRAYRAASPDMEDRVTFRYGGCSGDLALYWGLSAQAEFPYPQGLCGNPEAFRKAEIVRNLSDVEDLRPLVPPDPSVVMVGRTVSEELNFDESGTFGAIGDGGVCVTELFAAGGAVDATFVGSADADRIDFDVSTEALSQCIDLGAGLGTQCSKGLAFINAFVRFDLDITEAADYRLIVDLACENHLFGEESLLLVGTARQRPDGTVVPANATTAQFFVPWCGDSDPSPLVDHVLRFEAPAAGETDAAYVIVGITYGTGDDGEAPGPLEGSLTGFVSLERR